MPDRTKARRPLRTGGITLLGLGAVAALIGAGLLASGATHTSAGPVTSGRSAGGAAPATSLTPSASPAPPSWLTTRMATPAPGIAQAPAAAPAQPETGGDLSAKDKGVGEVPSSRGELRVYNNSMIHGLAERAARDFNYAGWKVVEVGNYSGGLIPTTTVYYREGTDERATAEAIGAEFGMRVEPRFAGIETAQPGVIAIVTNDYGS